MTARVGRAHDGAMKSSLPSPDPLALPDGLTLCDDGLVRPTWASHDALLRSYYDTEWGMPVHDEAGVYERLALEGFQAGLSWRTVLAKRESFREAFAGFSPDAVAAFTDVPSQTPESIALAADLKARGFRFVGPTTMLALMAAIGIVNTDIVGTHRRPAREDHR